MFDLADAEAAFTEPAQYVCVGPVVLLCQREEGRVVIIWIGAVVSGLRRQPRLLGGEFFAIRLGEGGGGQPQAERRYQADQ